MVKTLGAVVMIRTKAATVRTVDMKLEVAD
jgi:hypothetical protein